MNLNHQVNWHGDKAADKKIIALHSLTQIEASPRYFFTFKLFQATVAWPRAKDMNDECQSENEEQIVLIGCCLTAFFVISICWVIKLEIVYREGAQRRQEQTQQQIRNALSSMNKLKIDWNECGNGFG